MKEIKIYIYVDGEAKLIDLFKDETITLNSSIQNANDIAKTFTDYTQTFTVPASRTNNAIFKHWYENSYINGFDHRIRYDAFIELDTLFFRKGRIQLEKANIKNNAVDSYSITFYGNLVQLKDRFGEDKLNQLDYSSIQHTYNGVEVLTRITSTASYPVRYPLIAANTRYEYKTGATLYDVTISSTQSCIRYDSLYPAVSVPKIMEFIETKYDIDFVGSWLNDPLYTNLFLYAKNSDVLKPFGAETRINYGTSSFPTSGPSNSTPFFNLSTDVLTTPTNTSYAPGSPYLDYYLIELSISSTSNVYYNVYVYKNGSLYQTYLDRINNFTLQTIATYQGSYPNPTDEFYFTVSSSGALTYTSNLKWHLFSWSYQPSIDEWTEFEVIQYNANTTATQSSSGNIDVKNYVPDITVVDFFVGLVKMFNLIIDPQDERTFNLLPLEQYYSTGEYKDLTKYITTDSITLDRPKLYKSISFKYEESKNILNYAFNTTSGQIRGYSYGDLVLNNINNNESSNYDVKLPFEDVMWERAGAFNFQSATMWDKDLKPYVAKPVMMYLNGQENLGTGTTNTLKISLNANGTGITQSSRYIRFSNEYNLLGNTASDTSQVYSLNWGNEISSWYLSNINNSLYQVNYSNYLDNIYDIKTRLVKVKAILPTTIITNIKLNDRIIIKDKRYLINTMNINLTSGVVDFDLIVDNRII